MVHVRRERCVVPAGESPVPETVFRAAWDRVLGEVTKQEIEAGSIWSSMSRAVEEWGVAGDLGVACGREETGSLATPRAAAEVGPVGQRRLASCRHVNPG